MAFEQMAEQRAEWARAAGYRSYNEMMTCLYVMNNPGMRSLARSCWQECYGVMYRDVAAACMMRQCLADRFTPDGAIMTQTALCAAMRRLVRSGYMASGNWAL
jgi:hypothetical protein